MDAASYFSQGNEAFVDENYELSVEHYTKAIELNSSNAEYYIKRATAYIRLQKNKDAEADADKAIKLDPKNQKAYLRKGAALFNQDDFTSARALFKEGLTCNENNKEIKQWIRKCDAELDLAEEERKLGDSTSREVRTGTATNEIKSEEKQENHNAEIPKEITPPNIAAKPVQESQLINNARYDWYQTQTHIIINLLIKNRRAEDVKVEYGQKNLSVTIQLPSGSEYSLELDLAHDINPAKCRTRIMSTKIELKLQKIEDIRWSSLEVVDEPRFSHLPTEKHDKKETENVVHKYPTSRHVGKDWDKLDKEFEKELEADKPEGEAALNQLFQQIYGDGSDEVKKAMNKSFVESGGTVLSTNWKEVGDKQVECKPPDGMELKKWD